ncbi:double-stranded RNA-binding protein 2-like [Durio zibethinus]|uniref:Double-stranded RNA-binding protein 2-like n=1 Tax=Durio zibethinus TaxID=66656 RepID=A0A6P5YNN6_DURZI|nr:double-stranded RNA-binding protein 2-like [Durio zibethinus]
MEIIAKVPQLPTSIVCITGTFVVRRAFESVVLISPLCTSMFASDSLVANGKWAATFFCTANYNTSFKFPIEKHKHPLINCIMHKSPDKCKFEYIVKSKERKEKGGSSIAMQSHSSSHKLHLLRLSMFCYNQRTRESSKTVSCWESSGLKTVMQYYMFKNQLQELAQRSCFNLPSYACIREGPDHAPRFKASVSFNGEIFESPSYCHTLRQAEHSAAEVALNILSARGPSRSLTARVLDETGIYKNLLQETAHRAGLNLPVYTTVRSGPGHVPIFTCTVELAGMNFKGDPAKTKKQAEKNAAIAAWSALKRMPNLDLLTNKEADNREDQDQTVVSSALSSFKPKVESKKFRRRDYNQAKRRVVRINRDIGSPSSSTSGNSVLHQQWKLVDLLMDSALDGSTQKRNSIVSLLPPPPPRTASKILQPTSSRDTPSNYSSNRPIPIQIRGKSEVKLPPLLEEHLKDEEEWHGVKQDVINKSNEKEGSSSSYLVSNSNVYGASTSSTSIYRPVPISSIGRLDTCMLDSARRTEASQVISRLFGSPNPSQMTPTSVKAPTMARNMYTGGFSANRIAPAVKIRSVIPVCAAPPPLNRPQEITPSQLKEPSATILNTAASPSSSMSMQTGSAEVSSTSLVLFNKSQPNSDQLSSELVNLKLLK